MGKLKPNYTYHTFPCIIMLYKNSTQLEQSVRFCIHHKNG